MYCNNFQITTTTINGTEFLICDRSLKESPALFIITCTSIVMLIGFVICVFIMYRKQ